MLTAYQSNLYVHSVLPCITMTSSPEDVLALNYMKKLRVSLSTISGWPRTFDGSNVKSTVSLIYRCILISLMAFNIYNTIIYSKNHMDTDLGQTYLNVMLSSVYLKDFCVIIQKFILEFHLIHHKHKGDFNAETYDRVNKICKIFSIISLSQIIVAVFLYMAIPLYNNYKAGMFNEHKPQNYIFQHSIDFELPFDQYTTYRGYFVVFFYNCFNSYNVATGICMYDFLIFIIVFHIWGHLNILIHDLTYFSQITNERFDRKSPVREQDDMFHKLKDIIKHHQIIKEFMSSTSEAFSTPLCGYLIFHQLSGCVLLLKSSSLVSQVPIKFQMGYGLATDSSDLHPPAQWLCAVIEKLFTSFFVQEAADLTRYGLVTLILFQQLIETSVIFELIRSKGDTLADKVYELPWDRMDARNRKILVMFLNSVQSSLALKAGGMVPVGVKTMSAIIKTSFSYFIMLRTFTQS